MGSMAKWRGVFAAGGKLAEGFKGAVRGIDGEDRDGVVAAVRSVKPFAGGMNGDFGGIIAAAKSVRQRGKNLEFGERAFLGIVRERGDGVA